MAADPARDTHDDEQARRPRASALEPQTGPASETDSGAALRIAGHPAAAGRGNGAARASAVQRLQQTIGNRAAQRVIQRAFEWYPATKWPKSGQDWPDATPGGTVVPGPGPARDQGPAEEPSEASDPDAGPAPGGGSAPVGGAAEDPGAGGGFNPLPASMPGPDDDQDQ